MKRLFLLVAMFFFATALAPAQEWVGVGENAPVRIQETLVSSSEDEIVVDVKVGGFFQNTVETQQGIQTVIIGKDMASMLVAGAPDLPMYPISMIVGNTAEMEISYVKSSYVDFENIDVAPSKGNFSREVNPESVPYTYGDMYQKDAFYPAQQAELERPYILRDFRGQNLMVYPYAYNPVTKTLRVYTDLRISVKKVGDNGINQKTLTRRNNTVDPEVNAAYKRRFINYPKNERYSFVEDEGEMLVICVDEYKDAVQPLVEWKNISGRPTTMALVSETGTLGDMKNYIANYYQSHPNLTFVLLVGEFSDLPPYPLFLGRSDNFYGMLEGDSDDYYEEVLVGRLSVADNDDAKNQVDRIIYYERDIDETADWLSRGIGIGSTEGVGHFDERDYQHVDFIRDTLLHYTYTEISQWYNGVDNYILKAEDFSGDFNKGVGIANYCNHGEEDKWILGGFDTQCVNALTNDYMLPFIWSTACKNGQFDVEDCFAETWMRATNAETGAPTGAIGGMFSWISQPWQPPMYGQDEMVAILTEWREGYRHTLGGASLNGSMYILDMCPDDYGDTHNTWLLFGDPSMMLRTKAPEKMNVSLSYEKLMLGMSNLTVNADVDYGIATLSKDGEVVASSHFSKGQAKLDFPELTEEGTMKLVVVSYNKVTEVLDIEVKAATDAYVIFDAYDLNEADGQLDYGDTINLSLNVKNIGTKDASGLEVELVAKSEYVTMLENKASLASVTANSVAEINDVFEFTVADDVPNQEILKFEVKCTSGEVSWVSSFSMTANAPHFTIDTMYVKEELVEPGTDATLYISVKNDGDSEAKNIMSEILSSSSDIVFAESSFTEETLKAGEMLEIMASFEVDENAENGTLYEVAYSVKAGTYEMSSNCFITVGQTLEDFETGDLSKVDWQFEGDAEWIISTNAYEGTYCARSGKIGDKQASSMFVTVELAEETEVSFYYKTACDYYDKLYFYVDDEEVKYWNGNNSPANWEQFSYIVPKGIHTLKWSYKKSPADSHSDDCVYVDNIVLPPLKVVGFDKPEIVIDPVTNLNAEEDYGTVTLTWDVSENADSYIIKRGNIQLAEQTETTFTETLTENGTYTYSVIAKKDGNKSKPSTVTVVVESLDVTEINESDIEIYPNPASDVVYVSLMESFEATIYNYQGQTVKNINVDNGQINVSGLSNGMYFLEIRTENDVMLKKIVVK